MLSDIGLFINILGTLLIAYTFGVLDPRNFGAGGSTSDRKNREREIAYFSHPKWFKIGILLLVIGFLLQLNFIKSLLAQIRFR